MAVLQSGRLLVSQSIFTQFKLVREFVVSSRFFNHHIMKANEQAKTLELVEEGGILKSPRDKKRYKIIQLSNGLRALIISDVSVGTVGQHSPSPSPAPSESGESNDVDMGSEESDTEEDCEGKKLSSAALTVKVGSFSDPPNIQGMAHLLEHTILMGNDDYPEENSLDIFLNRYNGRLNATTECEHTTYHFQVPNKYMKEALKRFSSVFVAPLFRKESIEKEIRPVDNEFKNSFSNDEVRIHGLFSCMAKKDHPLGLFGWGNSLSLVDIPKSHNVDVGKEVMSFWKENYYASNMNLVVQAEYDVSTIEAWVREFFGRIPPAEGQINNNPGIFNDSKEFPYTDEFFRVYYMNPIESGDSIRIIWWFPPCFNCYKKKPLHHLAALLGHEGKGSLLSYLKKSGLALEIVAGNDEGNDHANQYQALFVVDIKLTDYGLENINVVTSSVFAFIDMIRKKGPQFQFLQEEEAIRSYSYAYANEVQSVKNCTTLSRNMCLFEQKDILTGSKLLFQKDEASIRESLEYMTPNKANFIVVSKKAYEKTNSPVRQEEWFKTNFKVIEVPQNWKSEQMPQDFYEEVHFPTPNVFVAENFDINPYHPSSCSYPTKILENSMCRVWYKNDDKFELPKAHIYVLFRSPFATSDPVIQCAMDLYINAFLLIVGEDIYPAELAELHCHLRLHIEGLTAYFWGFSDKIKQLIDLIIDKIVSFELDDRTFLDIRRKLAAEQFNTFTNRSFLGESVRLSILKPLHWPTIERRNHTFNLSKNTVLTIGRQFFSHLFMESLIQGNISSSTGIEIAEGILKKLNFKPLLTNPCIQERVNQLPTGNYVCRVLSFSEDEKKSVIVNHYQLQPLDIRTSCYLEMLCLLLDEPLFDTLRTQEGLGYEVYVECHDTHGIGCFSICVHNEADMHSSSFIDERIENFLKTFSKKLDEMKEEDFQESIRGMIKTKQEPFINLSKEVKFNWREISEARYSFDRREKEVKALQEITFGEFKKWAAYHISDLPHRKKISIQIVARGKVSLDECLVAKNDLASACESLDELGVASSLSELKAVTDCDPAQLPKDKSSHELIESKIYSLQYLLPRNPKEGEKYIVNINEFKKSLTLYPHRSVFYRKN